MKNKSRIQGFAAGVLASVLLMSGTTFAKQVAETAELYYNNIKVYINGAELSPTDVNGNSTEPFIMNGTTYLPVRAIASSLGKEVEWDGETQSVYIGKKDRTKPDNYLDKVQHNNYLEGHIDNNFQIINGKITDFQSIDYKSGILFHLYNTTLIDNDEDKPNSIISYPLNSQYKTLTGKIVLPASYNLTTGKNSCNVSQTDVWFYGDDKLLYKATSVTASMPFEFDIDVAGVNQLTIKIRVQASRGNDVALTDLALYK